MMRYFLCALISAVAVLAFYDPVFADESLSIRRYAFVVGANNGGQNREPLKYAVSDANTVAKVLRDLGGVASEDSIILENPDRRLFFSDVAKLKRMINSGGGKSRKIELLFYYSGHSDEDGLLLGNDIIEYREIKKVVDDINADVKIVILDSCSSGVFTNLKGGKRRAPFQIDSSYDMKGKAILTSSSADEASQESEKMRGSIFTHYLVSGLRGAADMSKDAKITLNEAYQFAYNETLFRTEKTMSGPQHPNYNIQMVGTGDVVLTDVSKSEGTLVLDESVTGRISVRDKHDQLIAEFRKPYGTRMSVGVSYGQFKVSMDDGRAFYNSDFAVVKDKPERELSVSDFSEGGRSSNPLKGGSDSKDKSKDEPESLVDPFASTYGFYGSFYNSFGKVRQNLGTYVGGRGMLLLNHSVGIGGGGKGLAYPLEMGAYFNDYKEKSDTFNFGYGGPIIEYKFKPLNVVNYSVSLLVGGGSLSYDSYIGDIKKTSPSDSVLVLEPELNVNVNIIKYVKVGIGVSYLYVRGVDSDCFKSKDFRSPMFSIIFSAGWF